MILKRTTKIFVGVGSLLIVSALVTYFIPSVFSKYKRFEFIHVVEVEALLLSVFALIFAFKQFRDSADFSKQLSTRFLSIFPDNMRDITDFIRQSVDKLDIMVDYAGYGAYSDPEGFSRYCDAIENRALTSAVRILLYSNDLAIAAIRQQWSEESFAKEKTNGRFERFLDHHQGLIQRKSSRDVVGLATYETFVELQVKAQVEIQHRLTNKKNIDMRFIDDAPLVVLAWIRPDHHAIFTFKNRGFQARERVFRELAFQTRDRALVDVFQGLFDQLWNAADPNTKTAEGQTGVAEVSAASKAAV